MAKKIGVIILNFNGLHDTQDCIKSLMKINASGFQWTGYVVDYSRNVKEKELLAEAFPSIQIIKEQGNLGFSAANNIGIRKALADGADYVLLLNNDTVVQKDFLQELFRYLESHPSVGAVSPKIYFAKGYEFHLSRYTPSQLGTVIWYAGGIIDWRNMYGSHRGVDEVDRGQFDKPEETAYLTGCCMLIRKEALKNSGLLDEDLFLYWEDLDFSLKLKQAGWKTMYVPSGVVWHKNAGSSGGSGSPLQDYFTTRNRLIIGSRYAPIRTKTALFKESLKRLLKGRTWERIGIRDYYFGIRGKGSYET